MDDLTRLLDDLELRVGRLDALPEDQQADVVAVIDGLDALHRSAVRQLVTELGDERVRELATRHPGIDWLFAAYGSDERAAADDALDTVRPFIHSHGGEVEVVDAAGGVVTVRLSGSCSGCTASAITLRHGVEEALVAHLPGFDRLEVVEDATAAPHPPPGATLLDERPTLPMFPGG